MAMKEAQKMMESPEPKVEEKPKRFVKVEELSFIAHEFATRAREEMEQKGVPADTRLRIRCRPDGTFSLLVKKLEGRK